MADMDCDDPADTKKAYKCNYQLMDNLNVVYNASNSMIIFWNKYQLFLYEDFNFDDATRLFIPEFLVRQILISNNYLLCLDCNRNVHVTSLKFKNCAQKRLKTTFQPREQNVMTWVQRDEHVLSLKLELEQYSLCLNKMVTELTKVKEVKIKYYDDTWPLPQTTQDKCFITAFKVPENDENIKQLFNIQESLKGYDIVVITFDRIETFACLFSPNMVEEEIQLVKLYSSPLEICTIQILEYEELNVLIALTSGTVIKLPLVKPATLPMPIHLNTPVYKFLASKDSLIYTDGTSMWKTEDTFKDIKFLQFFVRHVKDFARCGDRLICTTYSNLIYLLPVDDETIYLKPNYGLFCPADKLLNNAEYLYKIFDEAKRNHDVVKLLHEEGNYVTALALSNRPDLMESVFQNNVIVYEYYEDVVKENPGITLMEDLKEYFKINSIFFLVKITTLQMEHLVNEVMAQLLNTSKVHISLFLKDTLLKTNSMNTPGNLKNLNVLIPFDSQWITNITTVKVVVEIVLHIPGALDYKEPVWTTFYHKEIILNSEHFIKTDLISSKNITLRKPEEPLEDLILKMTINRHGNLFKFSNITSPRGLPSMLYLYVKLPSNYVDMFQNKDLLLTRFNTRKAECLFKQLSSEEFLQSKSNLTFEVGKVKVDIEIQTEEMNQVQTALLRVASDNGETALNIRNFLAELVYNDFKAQRPCVEFVNHTLYAVIQNLQKAIKECGDIKDLHTLTKVFQRNILGSLPI